MKKRFPRIGQRIMRSAAGVLLCYVIYILRGRNGIPFYSMIAAVQCIQPYTGKTREMAIQRMSGTLLGALYGLAAIMLELYLFGIYDTTAGYLMNALMIIPVLYTAVLLKQKNAAYFSCVVYLSIAVNHMGDANPFIFVCDRVLDTTIGIAVGIIVNAARLPRKRITDRLFICSLDDMLAPVSEELSAYSRIEINRMTDDGMQFTISTKRTPASLMKPLEGVNMKLPVIAMDGAALYDIRDNTYLKAYVISRDSGERLTKMIRAEGLNCFINALYDDTLVIYYDRLENDAERDMFARMKRSPYRNYIHGEPTERDRTIYILTLGKSDRIRAFHQKLISSEYGSQFRVVCYDSDDYKGYTYLKIYNKNSGRDNMIRYLKEAHSIADVQLIESGSERGLDAIVKKLKNSFEPLSFLKK